MKEELQNLHVVEISWIISGSMEVCPSRLISDAFLMKQIRKVTRLYMQREKVLLQLLLQASTSQRNCSKI